jgi:hypothetical protein
MVFVILFASIVGTASAVLGVWLHGMVLSIAVKYYFTGILSTMGAVALMSLGCRTYPRMLRLLHIR